MTILDEIIDHKRIEVAKKKAVHPRFELDALSPTRDFEAALRADGTSLIAEFKRCSPSGRNIKLEADLNMVTVTYEENGASALSVITDETYFCGKDDFVEKVKRVTGLPVLRKEFIIDPYQVDESRALGADAILLIATVLDRSRLADLLEQAQELGLACLVETHTAGEVEKVLATPARIIGVNNRNLKTLDVDLSTSLSLKRLIPEEIITVSESGIRRRGDVLKIEQAGFDGMLVGEALMRSPDIGLKTRELLGR